MKKLIALVLALAMVATLGLAFAAVPTTGSITVNPNNNGQTYTLYHLFDAEISFTGDDTNGYTQSAITYKLPTGKTLDTTGAQWFTVNSNGFVEKTTALTADVMKSDAFRTWAKNFGTANATTKTASQDNDPNVKWEGLPFGYYLVDSTLGAYVGIDSANPDVTIEDKNNPPKLDKQITSVKDSGNNDDGSIFAATDPSEIQWTGDGSNEHAIAQVGDTITYSIVITAKPGAQNYVLTDVMDAGLTPPAADGVSVMAGTVNLKNQETVTGAKDATVAVNTTTRTITVNFAQAYLNTLTADTDITITYTATLNSSAVVASGSNDNTATLTWGHKATPDYTTDQSKVWAAKIAVEKKIGSETGSPLAGAGFILRKNGTQKYYTLGTNNVVTWVEYADEAAAIAALKGTTNEHVSDANGDVDPFTGLPNGTYQLVESTVPNGYNKTTIAAITINGSNVTSDNLAKTSIVVNNAGTELPSTGGIGTTIFYIVGGLLVIGAAVILVARRKAHE